MTLDIAAEADNGGRALTCSASGANVDSYFSADVETDGPIPGPYSMLSFPLVYAGSFDGRGFIRPESYTTTFYREPRPISERFQVEALRVNGLDRERLCVSGEDPRDVSGLSRCPRWR